jgi:RNA 3'-terminal phosphate cyclase
MIVPYLVLAAGASDVSVSRITQHTKTNVKVAEWLTGTRFNLEGETDHPGKLQVMGIGSKP